MWQCMSTIWKAREISSKNIWMLRATMVIITIAFSVGNRERVDELTAELKKDGYEVVSGPRTTGDGYYESCIIAVEGNQIEITV